MNREEKKDAIVSGLKKGMSIDDLWDALDMTDAEALGTLTELVNENRVKVQVT